MDASHPRNRPAAAPRLVHVAGAVLCDNLASPERFLAARRSYPPEHAGRWEFPGGKVEPGESDRSALERELAEELGIGVVIGAQVPGPEPGGRWRTSPRHVMSVWWCVLAQAGGQAGPQLLGAHDQLAWVGAQDALALPWLPGDLPIVRAVIARLGS